MDTKSIDKSKKEVNDMFKDLSPIVLEIVDKYSSELDKMFHKLGNASNFTNDELREAMLALSVESYLFGMSKDASLLKQECATTLLKEGQAISYNNTEGTQAVRSNQAVIDTTDKQVVSLIYNGVANMMKTKLDEAHRMVNVLNSVLISRNAEAKMVNNKPDEPPTGRQRLLEEYGNNSSIVDNNTEVF